MVRTLPAVLSLLSPLSLPARDSLAEVVNAGSRPASDHHGTSSVTCSPGGHWSSVRHLTQSLGAQSRLLVDVGLGGDLLVDVRLGSDLLVDVGHDLGSGASRGNEGENDLDIRLVSREWEQY